MKFLFTLLQIIILSLVSNASAETNIPDQEVERFQRYLQNLDSVAIDFNQIDSSGKKADGKLLISKPYKFRCNYYAPFPLLIIGNKNYISFYDYDMAQISRIKASENIFNFLLLDKEDLIKHFDVEAVTADKNEFKIKLLHLETNKESQITFDAKSRQLKKLEIIEDNNLITINFADIKKVTKFPDELFIMKNADTYGPPARLGKNELEKKYTKLD